MVYFLSHKDSIILTRMKGSILESWIIDWPFYQINQSILLCISYHQSIDRTTSKEWGMLGTCTQCWNWRIGCPTELISYIWSTSPHVTYIHLICRTRCAIKIVTQKKNSRIFYVSYAKIDLPNKDQIISLLSLFYYFIFLWSFGTP